MEQEAVQNIFYHSPEQHADAERHGLQVQRAQELDAEGQEGVLLAHDFGRHLEDGLAWTGEPVFSRYNGPTTPWFMRRNEIWLHVSDKPG